MNPAGFLPSFKPPGIPTGFRSVLVAVVISGLGLSSLSGCSETISGSSVMVVVNYDYANFNRISTTRGCYTTVKQSNQFSVAVSINENLQSFLQVTEANGTLSIGLREGENYENAQLGATIMMPDLRAVTLTAGSRLSVQDSFVVSGDIDGTLSAGSAFDGTVACTNLLLILSEGSSTALKGEAHAMVLSFTGGSTANLLEFPVNRADITVNGGSTVAVAVRETLAVTAAGGSTVSYRGSPTITRSEVTGGSSLINIP